MQSRRINLPYSGSRVPSLLPPDDSKDHYPSSLIKLTSFMFYQTGLSPKVRFEKIASNTGEGGVYIVLKRCKTRVFQELEDFQRNFGYVGTWLNISKLSGRTSYQGVGSMLNSRNRLKAKST